MHGAQEYPDIPQTFVCPQQELLPCKSLPETLLFQLLGLSIATLSTVTHYELRFTLISNISLNSNAYRVIHHTGMLWSHPSETFGDTQSCKIPSSNRIKFRSITLGLMQSHRHFLSPYQTHMPVTKGCCRCTGCSGASVFALVPLFSCAKNSGAAPQSLKVHWGWQETGSTGRGTTGVEAEHRKLRLGRRNAWQHLEFS